MWKNKVWTELRKADPKQLSQSQVWTSPFITKLQVLETQIRILTLPYLPERAINFNFEISFKWLKTKLEMTNKPNFKYSCHPSIVLTRLNQENFVPRKQTCDLCIAFLTLWSCYFQITLNPDSRPTHAKTDPKFFTTAWPLDLMFFPILILIKILLLPQDTLTEGKIEAYIQQDSMMKTLQTPFNKLKNWKTIARPTILIQSPPNPPLYDWNTVIVPPSLN